MLENRCIRPIKINEEFKVSGLIKDTFNEFINDGFYSDEGVKNFLRYVNPHNINYRLKNNHLMLVAEEDNIIRGVIEVRDLNHIGLLFVDKNFTKNSIGTELLRHAIEICKENNKMLIDITVNADPHSVNVYKRLGFEAKSSQQVLNGIVFIPMALSCTK